MAPHSSDRQTSGFKQHTPVDDARTALLDRVSPIDRTETVPVGAADGRVIAESVTATRNVPHYRRAAMDGYAVSAQATFGATERSPAVLSIVARDPDTLEPDQAAPVYTGSAVPAEADAVVPIERVTKRNDQLEVETALATGANIAPVGEDIAADTELYTPGDVVGPSGLGVLKSIGRREVAVMAPPTVGVIPTGEELVQDNPAPGEAIETNGLTISRFVSRWGGRPEYRNIVTDDVDALRTAIQRDLTKDIVVTTGGSSVGDRDLLPEVIDELGEVLVHGVEIKPGHPVALGVVESTPVIALPGYPVSCIVTAMQFLRPVIKHVGQIPHSPLPTTTAELGEKIRSEPGVRTFARVQFTNSTDASPPVATPIRASGAGVLSSAALADGWVVVPDQREGLPAGERVTVEHWEGPR